MFILKDKRTGEISFEGTEANRNNPCWICADKHKNPSWCLVDRARGVCICPRVPSDKRIGDAGYWHSNASSAAGQITFERVKKKPVEELDWLLKWGEMLAQTTPADLDALAAALGIDRDYINALEVGTTAGAWGFAMRDECGNICGIKLRIRADNKKICVRGSRLGLVWSKRFNRTDKTLVVTEGESDCMVAAGWGMNAVARPSCSSCRAHVARLAKRKEVLIVADRDAAGKAGAQELRLALKPVAKSVVVIYPPCKDLRQWTREGGTLKAFDWLVRSMRGY